MASKFPKYGSLEWKIYQYEQAKIAKRGRNYKYATGNEFEELDRKGYIEYADEKHHFPSTGMDVVKRLRSEGNYATMLLVSNNVRGCPDVHIYYKPKVSKNKIGNINAVNQC